ncbi:MAG: VWA domain-containing protein [Succinivibrionaceae bacterium]|nr:VWA domain-containing protein [Succinivibrionaceae bacterium]
MKKTLLVSAMVALGLSAPALAEAEKPAPKCDHMDLVLVLDKSGSMHGLESDTIGGFNSMIEKQRKLEVKTDVTTVLFSDKYITLHAREDLGKVGEMTSQDYTTGGMTALLDAVGRTIDTVASYDNKQYENSKVVFVIITDGQENSSKEYTKDQLKRIVSERQERDKWEFVFLGANIDAVSEARSMGINSNHAIKYRNTESGVRANYNAVADFAAEAAAAEGEVSDAWKKEVEQDK